MARVPSKVTKIRGVIIPTSWDDQGNVTGIAISSHDEIEYWVDHKGKGLELLPFIRKEVEAAGVVREEEGRMIVRIRKYTVKEGIEALEAHPGPSGSDTV